ncbi:MAG: hypothetical protein GKR94_03790 [Gammaproteobacteria bacterium]|nr:hypothetical protein [Gammaproteobacteria bacterium]
MPETSLSTVELQILFGPAALEQGWQGFTEGRVWVTETLGDGGLRGQVRSEEGECFEVQVRLQRARDRLFVQTCCNCTAGKNCAHAAALLWQLVDGGCSDSSPPDDAAMTQWLGDIEQLTQGMSAAGLSDIVYLLLLGEHGVQPHVRVAHRQKNGATDAYDPADVLRDDLDVRLDGADRSILYELAELGYRPQHGLEMDGLLGAALLERLAATGRCWLQDMTGSPLRLAPQRALAIDWALSAASGCFQVSLQSEPRCTQVLNFAPPWFIDASSSQCGPLESSIPRVLSEELLCAPPASPANVGAVMNRLRTCSRSDDFGHLT